MKFAFKGVADLVDWHMTHVRGEYDESDFNVEAMKSHYGEGAFSFNCDYILIISTL